MSENNQDLQNDDFQPFVPPELDIDSLPSADPLVQLGLPPSALIRLTQSKPRRRLSGLVMVLAVVVALVAALVALVLALSGDDDPAPVSLDEVNSELAGIETAMAANDIFLATAETPVASETEETPQAEQDDSPPTAVEIDRPGAEQAEMKATRMAQRATLIARPAATSSDDSAAAQTASPVATPTTPLMAQQATQTVVAQTATQAAMQTATIQTATQQVILTSSAQTATQQLVIQTETAQTATQAAIQTQQAITENPAEEPTRTETPTETPLPPRVPGTISWAGTLNVRAGPGTQYQVLGSLSFGDAVAVVGVYNAVEAINYNQGDGPLEWFKIAIPCGPDEDPNADPPDCPTEGWVGSEFVDVGEADLSPIPTLTADDVPPPS